MIRLYDHLVVALVYDAKSIYHSLVKIDVYINTFYFIQVLVVVIAILNTKRGGFPHLLQSPDYPQTPIYNSFFT